MSSRQTLQTLPVDCLIEIVSYLSLPECLELRTACSQLKAAVDEHFRFVNTLPVVLSAPSSHAEELELEAYTREKNLYRYSEYGNVTFGPPATPDKCLTIFEDQRILHKQTDHFHREKFLILPNTPADIDGFIKFITKYMPKVSKLALLIDQKCTYKTLEHIERIVGVYRKQLKVLSLDKTSRSGWQRPSQEDTIDHAFVAPKSFYIFIEKLEALEELYFFPKKTPRIIGSNYGRKFVLNMLRKLKVVHTSYTLYTSKFETIALVAETLEEIDCYDWIWGNIRRYPEGSFRFPTVNKLHISIISLINTIPECMPNVRTLHFDGLVLFIVPENIESLNKFSQLERLHCYALLSQETFRNMFRRGNPVPELREIRANRTIKHLVIENLQNGEVPVETILNEVRLSLPYFAALETVTIREPFMKLTIDELRALQ